MRIYLEKQNITSMRGMSDFVSSIIRRNKKLKGILGGSEKRTLTNLPEESVHVVT